MSWKAGVAAELIGVPLGSMGERIYQSKLLLETADLFAWTAVVILLAWLCERAFLAFLRSTGPFALHLAVPRRTREADVTSSSEGICLEDVRLAYGDQVVFGGLSIDLPTGSRTCLVDASGVGKTSVLRLIAGETEPSAGSVSVPAVVSMMFQDSRLLDDLSAVDNVLLLCGSVSRERANSLLGEVLPVGVLDRPVRELSGGQRRRVELVRSLAFPGEAVLLDEPFGGLDETSHARSGSFICDHLGGRTLVVATHDVADAALLGGDAVRLLELDASRRPPTASDALPRE
jgi:NitT/TauT family transport system permease protein